MTRLAEIGQFDEALNICNNCTDRSLLADLDVNNIHERYADALFRKNDIADAIQHYIEADTHPMRVIELMPDLIPDGVPLPSYSPELSVLKKRNPSIAGHLRVAVAAMAKFCEHHRLKCKELADRVALHRAGSDETKTSDHKQAEADADTVILAVLIDTVLLNSYLCATPPKKQAMVELLRCA